MTCHVWVKEIKHFISMLLFRIFKLNLKIFSWDQDKGRLICSGNVRICRIWDAWAEKSIFDVSLRHGKGSVVNIASDLSCDLVGCGSFIFLNIFKLYY